MNGRQDAQSSIVKRIIDGSVSIDSAVEFENIIRIFPDDPGIYRAFADLLARNKSYEAAASAYRKASALFVDQGMMLQAIVAKILEWRIIQPTHKEGRAFHAVLRRENVQESSLQAFITQMTYPEMVAFMVNLVRVRLPAGKMVQRFGNQESHIHFIVSGALKETSFEVTPEGKKGRPLSSVELVENQFFGDIYPFTNQAVSRSDVETITRVELVRISRKRLQAVCQKHPRVESMLKDLYVGLRKTQGPDPSRHVRKAARHQLPTKVRLKIFPAEPDESPLVVDGITEDISQGGACLVLEARYRPGAPEGLIGKNVKIEIRLPDVEDIKILGTIVWSKDVSRDGDMGTAIGIQFKEMAPEDQVALGRYCFDSNGEQNLLWSLWETHVKH
ncbi:MAG: PilZ domain-containing protein [Deltaproteobacteria bacterium]|nr:PilZ domain-containing protein [Deltaproteobacteria bacterium]